MAAAKNPFRVKVEPAKLLGKIDNDLYLTVTVNGYNGETGTVGFQLVELQPKELQQKDASFEQTIRNVRISDSIPLTAEDVANWRKSGDDALVDVVLNDRGLKRAK